MTDEQRERLKEIQENTCPEGTPPDVDCCVERRFLLQLVEELEGLHETEKESRMAIGRMVQDFAIGKTYQQRDEYVRSLLKMEYSKLVAAGSMRVRVCRFCDTQWSSDVTLRHDPTCVIQKAKQHLNDE